MPRLAALASLSFALLLSACGDGEPLLPPDAVLPDGGRYRGAVVDGLLQGQGRIDYANGEWFEGSFKDGSYSGQGEWHSGQGEIYQGEFAQGKFNGQGNLQYSNGNRYQGQFSQGKPHGEGRLDNAELEYQGQFKQGQFDGLGQLKWRNGASYQGQFKQGSPAGLGVLNDAEGSQFSGTFKQGQLTGQGSYKSADGDLYTGEFRHNQFHGQGRYQSSSGDVWSGQFVDGQLSGKGEFTGSDGSHYQGQFRNWRYHGKGQLRLADGSQYDGAFSRDRYQGQGTLKNADGSQQSGVWQQGRLLRDASGKNLPDALAQGLLEQGHLLDQALAQLPASSPAIELYGLTLAGDGEQSVFMREADYVAKQLHERFAARGVVSLVNHRDHLLDRPLATSASLGRSIEVLAQRTGPEDVIFIYLTSHGSAEHELSLVQPRLQLSDLPASELASLLLPLKQRNKIVVISACYSGGFIPALKDDKTLVITAARADRVSFGCSEENDFTYFGRALFAEALQQTDDLQRAFSLAQKAVAEREQADGFEPSQPQIWAAPAVLKQWRKLREQQAEKALNDQPVPVSAEQLKP
ncbi:C13 family peptidase [Pseudomonas sp. 5P_3.1_Bac2]|uniref:C13 family peptidase n=1 Tax=Pseudomonas sp. 5P_3.1_Bac2 TaxID=2971617 RepID=UPI0021C918A2|nr:C13 family peptidase [Pseudomonas sp. 5P_3.1_Bac2]MCU1715582.1 peptidase C13 [Pseudomonas sp. 5P_3.1_Bac2]